MRACAPLMTGPHAALHPYSLSRFPPSHKASSGARTPSLAFGSAPWARRNSIAATSPFSAAKWKAVLRFCEGARKGTRHGRCSEHETRAKHRGGTTKSNLCGLGEGRCAQQQGLCYKPLLPRAQPAGLSAGGVGMLPYLMAMVLKCDETLQAAPRRRPLAIARLASRTPRVTFQDKCDFVRRGERRACAGGSWVHVHLS